MVQSSKVANDHDERVNSLIKMQIMNDESYGRAPESLILVQKNGVKKLHNY